VASRDEPLDIRLFLTEDEVERIVNLIDHAPKREPIDSRLLRIILKELGKFKDLKGGTNA
jgi:hypothetical protein